MSGCHISNCLAMRVLNNRQTHTHRRDRFYTLDHLRGREKHNLMQTWHFIDGISSTYDNTIDLFKLLFLKVFLRVTLIKGISGPLKYLYVSSCVRLLF